jgi:hypothetical protein
MLSTKNKNRNRKGKRSAQSNAGDREMTLSGFQPVMWPTVFPAKLVYSDFRAVSCASSQAEYVYRLNSVFDPDQTGVGGQPDGFDELKDQYGLYRVVAVDVEVQCVGQAANGLLAIAPSDTVGPFTSAEEVAGLRYAKSAVFSSTERARVRARYHIGKLLGYSDDSVLGNSNLDAAITGNPAFQQYLIVAVEGGTSSTQTQNIWTKITYYTRMEVPIAVLDAVSRHQHRFEMACASSQLPTSSLAPPSLPSDMVKSAITPTAAPLLSASESMAESVRQKCVRLPRVCLVCRLLKGKVTKQQLHADAGCCEVLKKCYESHDGLPFRHSAFMVQQASDVLGTAQYARPEYAEWVAELARLNPLTR